MNDIIGKKTDLVSKKSYYYSFKDNISFSIWRKVNQSLIDSGKDSSIVHQHRGNLPDNVIISKQKTASPSPDFIYAQIKHPNQSDYPGASVTVVFSKESYSLFKKSYGKHYSNILKKSSHKHLDTFNSHYFGNVISATRLNPHKLDKRITASFKFWNKLKPETIHLALISDKHLKRVSVLSFDTKSKRDLYIYKMKNIRNGYKSLPDSSRSEMLSAIEISNFHPIAVEKAMKNEIIKGSVADHLKRHTKTKSGIVQNSTLSNAEFSRIVETYKLGMNKAVEMGKNPKIMCLEGKDLTQIDFKSHDLRFISFKDCSFKDSDLSGSKLFNKTFDKCDFSGSNLSGTNFESSILSKCKFDHSYSNSKSPNFSHATITHSSFQDSSHNNATFKKALINKSDFSRSSFKDSNFNTVKIADSNFYRCNLKMTQFNNSIDNTSFRGAEITNSTLSPTIASKQVKTLNNISPVKSSVPSL